MGNLSVVLAAEAGPSLQTNGAAPWFFWCSIISAAVFSGIVGYWIGKGRALRSLPEVLTKAFMNMDNYIMVSALIFLIYSAGFTLTGGESDFAVFLLNAFSSMVFSWLLTKKTSVKDFKEKEEELALRSYRHINYIETAANTASGTIDKYASEHNDHLDVETKLKLSSANEQIKYIQGGINTCKMDWFDLLSEKEQNRRRGQETCNDDFGTVDAVLSDEDINQEDA